MMYQTSTARWFQTFPICKKNKYHHYDPWFEKTETKTTLWNTPLWKLTCPLKPDHFKRRFHLTTISFQGICYFSGGNYSFTRNQVHPTSTHIHRQYFQVCVFFRATDPTLVHKGFQFSSGQRLHQEHDLSGTPRKKHVQSAINVFFHNKTLLVT